MDSDPRYSKDGNTATGTVRDQVAPRFRIVGAIAAVLERGARAAWNPRPELEVEKRVRFLVPETARGPFSGDGERGFFAAGPARAFQVSGAQALAHRRTYQQGGNLGLAQEEL